MDESVVYEIEFTDGQNDFFYGIQSFDITEDARLVLYKNDGIHCVVAPGQWRWIKRAEIVQAHSAAA